MEQQLSHRGPVETAQVGSEMVVCIYEQSRAISGSNRLSPHWWQRWWDKDGETKMVSFILLLSLGKLEPSEVAPGRNETSALKESCVWGKGDSPNKSLTLSDCDSLSVCNRFLWNSTSTKQHFHKMHKVLQVMVVQCILQGIPRRDPAVWDLWEELPLTAGAARCGALCGVV